MADLNDMDLVGKYADHNSETAFAQLVQRHINLVYSVALRYAGNSQDAQDVTQAVFIILAKKSPALRRRTTLAGWLYETTRFTARQLLRTRARRQAREQEAYMESTLNDSDAGNVWRRFEPLLEDAMTRLNEKERTLLALRFFENKSGAEAAALLGIQEWAAHKRATRALEKLRRFFAKRGVSSTTAIIAGAISANSIQPAPVALAKSVTAMAIAKGAAASGSTLTLIKGALKIMAWTNAKTTIVGVIAVLSLTLGAVYLGSIARTEKMNLPVGNVTPMICKSYGYGTILAADGSLWSWGEEPLGWPVLGFANIRHTVSLRRIGQDNDWRNVASGEYHSLAIKSDGTLWAWGGNFNHQLGDGTVISRLTPVRSVPGNDWKQAAAGGQTSYALKQNGTLWAWGANSFGEFGVGHLEESPTAIQLDASTNWIKIWAGDIQAVGLQSDGSLWFWGSIDGNGRGTNNLTVPTRVSSDTNWIDVCIGYFTVLAIKSDGTLWTWGNEAKFYAQTDDASVSVTPRQIGTGGDWQAIVAQPGGFYHILKKKDGSFWALDATEYRTINPDSKYSALKVKKIDLQKDVVAFAAGGDDLGVMLTRDGEVWTWGKVLGEHSKQDFLGSNGKPNNPKYKVKDMPWQFSIIDAVK